MISWRVTCDICRLAAQRTLCPLLAQLGLVCWISPRHRMASDAVQQCLLSMAGLHHLFKFVVLACESLVSVGGLTEGRHGNTKVTGKKRKKVQPGHRSDHLPTLSVDNG